MFYAQDRGAIHEKKLYSAKPIVLIELVNDKTVEFLWG
jgi:hypothetical protein